MNGLVLASSLLSRMVPQEESREKIPKKELMRSSFFLFPAQLLSYYFILGIVDLALVL